jgi:hypothetical protein
MKKFIYSIKALFNWGYIDISSVFNKAFNSALAPMKQALHVKAVTHIEWAPRAHAAANYCKSLPTKRPIYGSWRQCKRPL